MDKYYTAINVIGYIFLFGQLIFALFMAWKFNRPQALAELMIAYGFVAVLCFGMLGNMIFPDLKNIPIGLYWIMAFFTSNPILIMWYISLNRKQIKENRISNKENPEDGLQPPQI